jgi:hypothetical protein
MSFASRYQERFERVIAPAIGSLNSAGRTLAPRRVDVSKSGDSILTDISDGIAHAQLVLADVSSIGRDSVDGSGYRNGNVMYEVGLALACRHPSEVLLIRDDHERFLFDVSTVPHVTIDFTNTAEAVSTLSTELSARLGEQKFFRDARVQMAIASLSPEEVIYLKHRQEYGQNIVWAREVKNVATWEGVATSRLLDKGILRLAGEFENQELIQPALAFTPLGYVVHQQVVGHLSKFQADRPPERNANNSDGDEANQTT